MSDEPTLLCRDGKRRTLTSAPMDDRPTRIDGPPVWAPGKPHWDHGAETMRATILRYLRRELAACHRFEVQQALRAHIARIEHMEPEAPR